MNKSGTHQYRLRLSTKLKSLLSELAWGHRTSFAGEVVNRVTNKDFQKEYPTTTPRQELTEGESVLTTIHFPIEIYQELKSKSEQYRRSVNAEILNRLYQSDPLADYRQMVGEEGGKYMESKQVEETGQKDKGLCPQNEREKKMLEMYRQLTPDQQAQLNAIGDTFNQPIKHKKSG